MMCVFFSFEITRLDVGLVDRLFPGRVIRIRMPELVFLILANRLKIFVLWGYYHGSWSSILSRSN